MSLKRNKLPSQEYLLKRFKYFPDTGNLRWRKRIIRPDFVRIDKGWNTKYAGIRAGKLNNGGYVEIDLDYVTYSAARIIFKILYNLEPYEVDHIDTNRSNNRKNNLRAATAYQNNSNRILGTNNSSGTKGVYLSKRGKYTYWMGEIVSNGKKYYTKLFNIDKYPNAKDLAIEAIRKLRIQLHKEFANHG